MSKKPEDKLSNKLKLQLVSWQLEGFGITGFHVPNEFVPKTNAARAWEAKEFIGCVKGAPDWVLRCGAGCLTVELKDAKSDAEAWRKCSEEQKEYAMRAWKAGEEHIVAWNVEAVAEAVRGLGWLGD